MCYDWQRVRARLWVNVRGSVNKAAIVAAGGVERLLAAMAVHGDDEGVLGSGCGTLWSLAKIAGTCAIDSAVRRY